MMCNKEETMRKHIKKGMTYILCASMVAALLSGCSSRKAESSKPSIHIDEYTKVGYDTATVQSGRSEEHTSELQSRE